MVRCSECGITLTPQRRLGGERSRCERCRSRLRARAERAAELERVPRAVCAGCGKTLTIPERADGRHRFCAAPKCQQAFDVWRLRNDPAYRRMRYAAAKAWRSRQR